MKTAAYHPDRDAGALSLQKQPFAGVLTKAIIDIFAMKTCTKLGPKLVRHSVGSRHC
jgi:hypothetical protein